MKMLSVEGLVIGSLLMVSYVLVAADSAPSLDRTESAEDAFKRLNLNPNQHQPLRMSAPQEGSSFKSMNPFPHPLVEKIHRNPDHLSQLNERQLGSLLASPDFENAFADGDSDFDVKRMASLYPDEEEQMRLLNDHMFDGEVKGMKSVPNKVSNDPKQVDLFGAARRGQKEEVQGDHPKGDVTYQKTHSFSNSNFKHSAQSYSMSSVSTPYPSSPFGDLYFVMVVTGCSVIALFGVIGTGYCVYKVNQHNKAAADVDYPAYGVVGPISKEVLANAASHGSNGGIGSPLGSGGASPSGDRKLSESAQMFHFKQQKQQMVSSATHRANSGQGNNVAPNPHAEVDSEEDEDSYIVYECPGLAPTGEMEVKNPLFQDDSTPNSPMKTPNK